MGSKFIRVEGRLQSESGVVHIVAEKMVDLSAWLADLSEEAWLASQLTSSMERGGALSGLELEALARTTNATMPKGRNFQ